MKLEYCAGSNGTLTHKTFKQKISVSFKLSQTPTLKVSEKKEKEKGTLTHAQNTHSHLHRRQGDSHKHSLTHKTLTLTYIGGKGTPIHGTLFFSLSLDWVAANCFG